MDKDDRRALTDADVEAITEALRQKIITEFYRDLGRGVWSWAWKAVVMTMVAIAAYGASKGIN